MWTTASLALIVLVTSRDPESLRSKCVTGRAQSCVTLAELELDGHGVPVDREGAAEHLGHACLLGLASACARAADMALIGDGVRRDYGVARRFYEDGCRAHDGASCAGLGGLFRDGLGVDKDSWLATKLYRHGCETLASRRACRELGYDIFFGPTDMRQKDRAVRIMRLACRAGDAPACTLVGTIESYGRDPMAALSGAEWYARGCRLGDNNGCTGYAALYMAAGVDGRRVTWSLTRGCTLGAGIACYVLAGKHLSEPMRFNELIEAACAAGFQPGCWLVSGFDDEIARS